MHSLVVRVCGCADVLVVVHLLYNSAGTCGHIQVPSILA